MLPHLNDRKRNRNHNGKSNNKPHNPAPFLPHFQHEALYHH
jgi:hypothetical protein